MTDWPDEVGQVLAADFSGVVSVSRAGEVIFEQAYGLADRAHGIACTPQTRFAIASGTKAMTALVVLKLVSDGSLTLATSARSVLGDDLPLIAADVTVEHLLNHTSGIGDYVDEETGELPLSVPAYALVDTRDYLPALDGIPTKFPAGARFGYCNSGYVVLALITERITGRGYHELVRDQVLTPAHMRDTDFLRSDRLPGDAALGYLPDGRTNVFALPVRGNGDGGIYTTVADVRRLWAALFDGRLLDPQWVDRMTTPQSAGPPEHGMAYGYGFWLDGTAVVLDGGDHGVAFRSVFDRASGACCTVIANIETPISPVVARLRELIG